MYQSLSHFCETCGARNDTSSLFCHVCSQALQQENILSTQDIAPHEISSDERSFQKIAFNETDDADNPFRNPPGEKIYPRPRRTGSIARRTILAGATVLGSALLYADFSQVFSRVSAAFQQNEQDSYIPPENSLSNQSSSSFFNDKTLAQRYGLPLSKIRVTAGNIINDVQTFYGRQGLPVPAHGGAKSPTPVDVIIAPSDPLIAVSGFTGEWFANKYVLQLSFHTLSGTVHGPFGNMEYATSAVPFTLTAPSGSAVLAFSGMMAVDGNGNYYLSSINISTVPFRSS